ncbi:hypothetical protein IAT38_002303 [Cryptococcus sp. DSM 104549]
MAQHINMIVAFIRRTYPLPPVDPEWVKQCVEALLVAGAEANTDDVHFEYLNSDLALCTLASRVVFPPGDLHDRILFPQPTVLQIHALSEIGFSAFQVQTTMEQRSEVLSGMNKIRRIDDRPRVGENGEALENGEEEGEEEEVEGRVPPYPRGMLRLEVGDGRRIIKAMEYQRIADLVLGQTSLGSKLLVQNVRVLRNILLLTPGNTQVLDGSVEDLESRQKMDFVNGLRRRMGKPELDEEGQAAPAAAPAPAPAPRVLPPPMRPPRQAAAAPAAAQPRQATLNLAPAPPRAPARAPTGTPAPASAPKQTTSPFFSASRPRAQEAPAAAAGPSSRSRLSRTVVVDDEDIDFDDEFDDSFLQHLDKAEAEAMAKNQAGSSGRAASGPGAGMGVGVGKGKGKGRTEEEEMSEDDEIAIVGRSTTQRASLRTTTSSTSGSITARSTTQTSARTVASKPPGPAPAPASSSKTPAKKRYIDIDDDMDIDDYDIDEFDIQELEAAEAKALALVSSSASSKKRATAASSSASASGSRPGAAVKQTARRGKPFMSGSASSSRAGTGGSQRGESWKATFVDGSSDVEDSQKENRVPEVIEISD